MGDGKWETGNGKAGKWEMGKRKWGSRVGDGANGKREMGKRGKGHGKQGLEQGLVKIVVWNTRNKENGFSKLEHKHF